MSIDAELNGIYLRLMKLEDVAAARGFILEALCATLSHANPQLYKVLVEGVMDDLNDMEEGKNTEGIEQELRKLLRLHPSEG